MKHLKYTPTIANALVNMLCLIAATILFAGRKNARFYIPALNEIFPDFYQHVSNLSISYLLLSGVGYIWLLLDIPFKYITGCVVFLFISNLVCELFIAVGNVPDITDAYYGFAGTLFAFLFLWLTKVFGLKRVVTSNDRG